MDFKAAAVIAEYNPFPRGHARHIARTRDAGATHVVAVMSGDFVQRGDCACVSKWTRAEMALSGGVDLVVELPVAWAVSGAERFALGGVALADALGCVSLLSFGSEGGDADRLLEVAALLESPAFGETLRPWLDAGLTFADARQRACEQLLPDCGRLLRAPNDALAIEYCRALNRLGSAMEPLCVRREGAMHDDAPADGIASASHLRRLLADGGDASPFMPEAAYRFLSEATGRGEAPALLERLDRTVLYALRTADPSALAALPDLSEGLENRIAACAREAVSFAGLCDSVKVKRYTHARIRRVALSAVLGLTADSGSGTPPYIRVLAMNALGRELLSRARPTLPVVTRRADVERLDERCHAVFALGMRAADIFALCTPEVQPCGSDAAHGVIVR